MQNWSQLEFYQGESDEARQLVVQAITRLHTKNKIDWKTVVDFLNCVVGNDLKSMELGWHVVLDDVETIVLQSLTMSPVTLFRGVIWSENKPADESIVKFATNMVFLTFVLKRKFRSRKLCVAQ